MKTKQEVINFLESKVGTKVPCKGNSSLDGHCVTLIKALMEFLDMPDPYKARGHANTCIQTYLDEGIADKGIGFLSVFSNKNMGGDYGHVWCNAGEGNGVYYESNGAKSLICTKGKTYQYDHVCNFDRYIKDNPVEDTKPSTDGKDEMQTLEFLDCANFETAERKLIEHLGISGKKCAWGDASGKDTGGYLGSERRQNEALKEQLSKQNIELAVSREAIKQLEEINAAYEDERLELKKQINTFDETIIDKNKKLEQLQKELMTLKTQCNIDYITSLERENSELKTQISGMTVYNTKEEWDRLHQYIKQLENRSLWEMLVERLKELLG